MKSKYCMQCTQSAAWYIVTGEKGDGLLGYCSPCIFRWFVQAEADPAEVVIIYPAAYLEVIDNGLRAARDESDQVETVYHLGQAFRIDLTAPRMPAVHYLKSLAVGNDLFIEYRCQRDHAGPDFSVLLKNPELVSDEVLHDGIFWADDKTDLRISAPSLFDRYAEAIREEWCKIAAAGPDARSE